MFYLHLYKSIFSTINTHLYPYVLHAILQNQTNKNQFQLPVLISIQLKFNTYNYQWA